MDFKDSIKQLSERVLKLKDNLQTEEATKTALIMPFIQMLGYDVFNPLEVMPEYTFKLFAKQVYDGLLTQKMLEQFTVKKYTTMKQILLLSITMFMLTACVSRRPYTEDSYTISYSDHKDIFITESNSVNFEYEPIGSVSATIGSGYKGRKFIEATEDEVIKKLCKESKLLGANGIINFRITYSVDNRYTKPNPAIIITATGMAIKF